MQAGRITFAIVPPLIFAVVGVGRSQTPDATAVTTKNGAVRGVAKSGVISWKAIPYAAPPVGKLRWRVPLPPVAWSGVREARQFGPACMQADDVLKPEDCLFLNVWRPEKASGQPYPVMIWIHGGAMVHGQLNVYTRAIGVAASKDRLFAAFGSHAADARKLYGPRGDQTLDELNQQVFADRTLGEPTRQLANDLTRSGHPVWLYRFAM